MKLHSVYSFVAVCFPSVMIVNIIQVIMYSCNLFIIVTELFSLFIMHYSHLTIDLSILP